MQPQVEGTSSDAPMQQALRAARERPSDFVVWDALEAQAGRTQSPEPVAELYVEVLQSEQSKASLRMLRERALRFAEEWFGDDAPQMQALLVRVFELEPHDDVIFERLVVCLTAAGRPDVLLHVYDVALAATDSLERRVQLLEDAVKVASELPGGEPRTLALLQELLALRPLDANARAQAEKLLEQSGRYHELVVSLQLRRDRLEGAAATELDARIASVWLRQLASAPHAFAIVKKLLAKDPAHAEALAITEEILATPTAHANTRREALALLSDLHDRAGRLVERARVLRAGLALYEGKEREQRQRALANMLREVDPAEAFAELGESFVRAPEDEALLGKLEEQAAREQRTAVLADIVERASGHAETPLRRHQLALRAAAMHEKAAPKSERALLLYRSVLEQDDAKSEALEAGRALDVLYDAEGDKPARIRVLKRLAELEPMAEVRREWLGALAKLALEVEDDEQALFAYRERIKASPQDQEALDALVALYEERKEYEPLVQVLRQRASTLGGRLAARDFARIGQIYANELDDLESALKALSELNAASPELAEELQLGGLLERSAERIVSDAARTSTTLGNAYRDWLADAERALAHYARALMANPSLESARDGLKVLLANDNVRAKAADVLASAYATTDDVDSLLALLPHRLATATSSGERARLLRQAAQLEATRRNAPEAALAHAVAALIEDPNDNSGDLEVWRLAEQLGAWKDLVGALHKAADRIDPGAPRHAQLRVSEGELSELRLLDLPAALEAYQAATKAMPGDPGLGEAVVRVAALLDRYGDAFDIIIAVADRVDSVPDGLLSLLEERAGDSDAFAKLCDAARASLAKARASAPVRRELSLRVAEWYDKRAGDAALAEAVLLDAGKLGGPHAETLRRLAAIQRRKPSRALFDTLGAAAELHDRELVQLSEAAELARSTLKEDALERAMLERLVARGSQLLRAGLRASDGSSPEEVLVDATTRLADKLSAAKETQAELNLLRDAAAFPVAKESARLFAERAARLSSSLGEAEQTIALYQRALELAPNDPSLLAALGVEYDRAGKLDDLVVLKRRELSVTPVVGRRLELRLELSRVLGELEARGGRLAALRENLREAPGHKDTIEAAERILRQQGALGEVYDLWAHEAAQLEAVGETYRAAALWSRAAVLADEELKDEERALSAYQKLAGLEHDERALDSLARIRLGRGEPALAVPWLERSLETRSPEARVPVRVRLSRAYQAAHDVESAMRSLEAGVAESPDAFELRDLLADLYERHQRWQPLAELLAESATRTKDRAVLLSYARKASQLFSGRLATPERAVGVLSRAVEAHPDDRALKLDYVDALIAAARLDDAHKVLDAMIEEYGRRRSPERAELHLRMSRVAKGKGELDEALQQLDLAASMDRAHPAILRSLGELAVEAGQLDRAERAYRTLLLIVRKPTPGTDTDVGAAEVMYQLHRIALSLGQTDKAAELLEQAVQTAVQSDVETARLKTLLMERGEPELLMRVLEMRLAQVSDPATEAEVLSDLADVLEKTLGRADEAFEARLKALASAPELDALHVAALRVASALGKERRYVDTLMALVERARRKDALTLMSDLSLRAGSVAEHALSDLQAAETAYRQVTADVPGYVEAQFALARVAGKLGHEDEERRVLERIALLPDDPDHVEGKRAALYRLIEFRVQERETREEGLWKLSQLVNVQPDYARASQILKVAYERDPADSSTLTLLEQMARRSNDPRVLLDALERRARTDDVQLNLVREAAELALRLGENARAEKLLERALELADARDAAGEAAWAPVLLARSLQKRGDVAASLGWLERAMSVSPPAEAFELGLELAALAAESDKARATAIYEKLREREPNDRRVWGPLLTFYKEAGELDRLLSVVKTTLEALENQADRNALRLQTANLLFEAEREAQGAKLLEDVLAEDPDHAEAALKLADLYEQRGEQGALIDLLSRKLETARERKSPSVIPLSLRMGAMLSADKPDQAVELYRQALSVMPDSDELLRAAIEQADPEAHGAERASLITRYLSAEDAGKRPQALDYARWLVEFQSAEVEPLAYERALELAHKVAPSDAGLRKKLTEWHREHGGYARLAELLEDESERLQPEAKGARELKIALLTETADLRLHRLGQSQQAAALLRRARDLAPNDFGLLKRAVQASAATGELGAALAEIDSALGKTSEAAQRVELLLLRADTSRLAQMHDEAVVALTSAHELGGDAVLEPLLEGIENARAVARERGNLPRERELTLRLANLFYQREESERAIEVLQTWLAHAHNDPPALRMLLELTSSEQRWDAAAKLAAQLCEVEEPAALAAVTEKLLEAARALGRPELARAGLERAAERAPGDQTIPQLLEQLYMELGEKRALAELLAERSERETDSERRFEQLRKVGHLLVEAGDPERAMHYLQRALEVKPDDLPTVLGVVDAHITAGNAGAARDLIERTMGALRQRRSPELGQLRFRMSRLLSAEGDEHGRYEWLNSALDADMNNGEVASELAVVAQEQGQLDAALKALRAITMMKAEAPMSRAEAFYRQAIIVAQKGEPRRAVLWAKKAKAEDQHFPGVDRLIQDLESA